MDTRPNLTGKNALVTGAARGLGRATALALARAGADVLVAWRTREADARALAEELAALGRRAQAVRCDVEQPGEVEQMFAAAGDFGGADILVNNVGDFLIRDLAETEWEEWAGITRNNLDSVFLCCRAALPVMRARGWGRIVNLTAAFAAGERAAPRMGAYQAAKAGVLALTRTLALEEAAHGITVNAVAPGIMDTEGAGPKVRAHPEQFVPAGRLGRPEEVARVVAFLCDPASGFITGAHLPVAGGWML
ncbi:MAG TPA: SDR family NAD(P)-dependent oxidoreductase [Candidatus Saccharimonadales bacterium]|nr:SDR family NAD(P)-dependent oxidoreductase [Candidatus Saccharimonadales bacterium]